MVDSKYKIVFVDIDGTLADDEQRISPETIYMITKLKKYRSARSFSFRKTNQKHRNI